MTAYCFGAPKVLFISFIVITLNATSPMILCGEESVSPEQVAKRRKEIGRQIQRLQSEKWTDREAAMGALREFGSEALPQLSGLDTQGDADTAKRIIILIKEARMATSGRLKDLVGNLMVSYVERTASERITILRAVMRKAGSEAIPLLLGLLDAETDESVLSEIISQLGWQVADPDALKPLLKFYKHCPERLKGPALWALAAIPSEASNEAARAALKDTTPGVTNWAIRCLVRLSDRESLPDLRKIAMGDEDTNEQTQLQAMRALTNLIDREASAIFKKHLDSSVTLQRMAISGISGLRDKTASAKIKTMFEDEKNKDIRTELIGAMGAIRDLQFKPLLIKLLKHEASEIRVASIQALQQLEAAEAAPAFAKLLLDNDPETRQTAAHALAAFGYKEALPQINIARKSANNPHARWSFLQAAANLGDANARKEIVVLAEGQQDWIAEQALGLISRWHISEGLPLLKARAESGSETAIWGLLTFTHDIKSFRKLLKSHLKNYLQNPTRTYAASQLSYLLGEGGLHDLAVEIMKSSVRLHPRDINGLTRLASVLHAGGKFNECAAAYERFQAIAGTNATYLNNHAWFYCTAFSAKHLKPKKALEMVQRALAMDPLSPYFVDTLGWALYAAGDHPEAVRQLSRALRLKDAADLPGCAWQRTRIARPLWASGKKEQALKEIEQAIQTAPEDPKVWFEAAGFYAFSAHRDQAIHCIHRAVDQGWLDVTSMQLNPEFLAIQSDPGFTFAIQRAERELQKWKRVYREVEAEVQSERSKKLPLKGNVKR